jgi:imidazolonepropionase-like amidohydrolase
MTPGTNINVAQYSVSEISAAVEEARRRHVTIAAHALGSAGLRNAVAAGVDTIEHFNWLGADGQVEFDPEVARQMVRQGTGAVLTLVALRRATAELRAQIVGAMRRARELGVLMLAGTDAGVALTPFNSLPRELELMVGDIGLTPMEAIVAATSAPARVLGLAEEVGALAPGLLADVVAVEGDPSQRIEDLRQVRLVLQAGTRVVEDGVLLG